MASRGLLATYRSHRRFMDVVCARDLLLVRDMAG